jgi:murein L,D-transpeptidase YafK
MLFINRFILAVCLIFIFPFNSFSQESKLFPADIIYSDSENLRVVLVDKKSQKLSLIEKNNNYYQSKLEFRCSTGKNQGDKAFEGDSKTPEGVYVITGHYTEKYLSPVYGTRALTLDYPNYLDRAEGKNGYNIWIHGTDKEPLEDRTTNGCVALDNDDINKLSEYVDVGKTPVIITKNANFIEESEYLDRKQKFLEFFNLWANSIEQGTYHDFLKFYSKDYLPDLSWWEEWQSLKTELESVSLKKNLLSVFRENDGVYTLWFDFFLDAKNTASENLKRKLFVRAEKDGLKIIGDVYSEKSEDIITAGIKIRDKILYEKDVNELIELWAKAWSDKNISVYGSCYSSDFTSDGMSKKGWLKYKDRLNKKYNFIKIDFKKPEIEKKGSFVKAVFYQTYESSGFKTSGIKTLMLKKEEGKWRIFKEIWKETG